MNMVTGLLSADKDLFSLVIFDTQQMSKLVQGHIETPGKNLIRGCEQRIACDVTLADLRGKS